MKRYFMNGKSIAICMALTVYCYTGVQVFAQQENRQVSGFNAISYSLPGSLEIYQGKTESLTLKGDADQIKEIITKVQDGELKIYTDHHSGDKLGDIRIIVTVIDLNELSVAGSGEVEIKTALKTDNLEINLSGSGNIKCMELSAKSTEINLAGSGDLHLGGTASQDIEINIAGSGSVNAESLQAMEGEVNISGSGSATVYITEALETNIIGSGDTYYKGNPRIETSVTGSGSTKPL
jgi:hypothetical protein